MKLPKLLPLFSIFLFSLVIAVSCTPNQQTSTFKNTSSVSSNTPLIKLGFSNWPGWLPWQVAEEQKLFETNKVNVDLKWFDGYLDSINALKAGQLDANTQTLNDTISSVASGSDQVIVLVNDNSTGNDKIIVREGINSINDLKGKKVAAEQGTVDYFLILLALKSAGLTEADIQFQPLETEAAAAAFVANKVDAVGVFAPFTTKALRRPGSKELFSSRDFPGAISDHLVVSRRLINERPEDVQALVDTWFATVDFMNANQKKADEIMAKRSGVPIQEYEKYHEGIKIFTLEENLKAFSPGKDMTSLPYAAEEISKFLLKAGLTKKAPDIGRVLDDRFVKAYAAKASKK